MYTKDKSTTSENRNMKYGFSNLGRRVPLTFKMVLLTIMVGIIVWALIDNVLTTKLKNIFHAELAKKLDESAVEDRQNLDHYLTAFQELPGLIIKQKDFIDYIESRKWSERDAIQVIYHEQFPNWFPKQSTLRILSRPRHVLLLDNAGKTREVFRRNKDKLPPSLLAPSNLIIAKSNGQGLMTLLDGIPYLISAESYSDYTGKLRAVLLVCTPLDNEFLSDVLRAFHQKHLVALASVGEYPRVLASSNPDMLPVGTGIEALQDRYLITGKEFFDYGASEIQVKFFSFVSLNEIRALTQSVISNERQERSILALSLILVFVLMMYLISKRLQHITMQIAAFSQDFLGVKSQEMPKGDQIHILKERFEQLTEEVVRARETIKKHAEEKADKLVDSTFDAIVTTDANGVITTWNTQAEHLFGWSREEAVGRMSADTIMPAQYREAQELAGKYPLRECPEGARGSQFEAVAFHRSGHKIPVELAVCPSRIEDESILITIIRDLTELKKSEEELKKFKFISDNSNDAHLLLDREGKFQYVNRTACRMLGYTESDLLALTFSDVDTAYGKEKYQELFDRIQKDKVKSIETINKRKDGDIFHSEITVTGYQINDKPYIFAALRDITERKQVEEALLKSENQLKTIFDNLKDGILLIQTPDVEAKKFCGANNTMTQMLGYTIEEIKSLGIANIHPEESLPYVMEQFEKTKKGEIEIARDIPVKRKDGSIFYADIAGSYLALCGEKCLMGIFRDVTWRKHPEIALRTERDKVQKYLDIAGVIIVVINADQKVSLINKKGCEVLECIEAEVIGRNWFDTFIPERKIEEVKAVFNRLMAGEIDLDEYAENPVLTKNGEERIIAWHNTILKDEGGNIIGTLSSGDDVTERKQLDEVLRKFRRIVSATPDHISIINSDYIYEVVNESYLKAHGKDRDQIVGHSVSELLGEEVFERIVKGYLDRCLEGETINYQSWFEFAASGRRFMDVTYYPYIVRGNICGVVVSSRDITELKETEEELRFALDEAQKRGAEISALLKGSRAVLELHDFKTIAKNIYDSCKNLIGGAAGYVALLSDDGTQNDVLFLDSGGLSCTVDPDLPMPIRGLRETAYRTGKVEYHNNFSDSEWNKFLPEGHACLENVLFAPLVIEGKAVGLLGLANKPGGFTVNDAWISLAFGELIAIALLNSRTMEALKDSEMRFRSVVESASDAIISIDSLGNIISWNSAAENIFGFAFNEIVGKPLTILIPESFREAHQNGMNRVISQGTSNIVGKTIEIAALRKDGEEFPVELSLASWKVGQGIYFTGIIRDITGRKWAEEALRKAKEDMEIRVEERTIELKSAVVLLRDEIINRLKKEDALIASQSRLESIKQIGEMASASLDLNKVLHSILKGTLTASGASVGMILIKNPDSGLFTWGASIGLSDPFVEEYRKRHISIGEGLTGRIAQTGETIYIAEDSSHDPRIARPVVEAEGLNSFIGVPIYAASEIVGVMNVLTRPPDKLSEQEIGLVSAIGAHVGSAIKNAQLFEERKKAEEAFRESHERLLLVLNGLDAVVYVADMETYEILFVNKHIRDIYGDVEGKICWQTFQKDQTGPCRFCTNDKLVDPQGMLFDVHKWEFQNTMNDRWYFIQDRAVRWVDGRIVRLEIATDITERKLTEKNIRESLKEKEVMLKEIHHRVKNNLQVICSLFSLQNRYIKDKETFEMIKECQSRIKAMSLVHEKLYQSETLANIDLKDYISDLTNSLFNAHEVNPDRITLRLDVDDISLDINAAIPCGLIINELVTNSILYAFPEGMKGEINILVRLTETDEIRIIISDNGVGLPKDIDIRNIESLGLIIVNALINQLNGKIEIDRSAGTTFNIAFRRKR